MLRQLPILIALLVPDLALAQQAGFDSVPAEEIMLIPALPESPLLRLPAAMAAEQWLPIESAVAPTASGHDWNDFLDHWPASNNLGAEMAAANPIPPFNPEYFEFDPDQPGGGFSPFALPGYPGGYQTNITSGYPDGMGSGTLGYPGGLGGQSMPGYCPTPPQPPVLPPNFRVADTHFGIFNNTGHAAFVTLTSMVTYRLGPGEFVMVELAAGIAEIRGNLPWQEAGSSQVHSIEQVFRAGKVYLVTRPGYAVQLSQL